MDINIKYALNNTGKIIKYTEYKDDSSIYMAIQKNNESKDEFIDRINEASIYNIDSEVLNKDEFIVALNKLDIGLESIGKTIDINAIGGFALLFHNIRKDIAGYTVDIDSVTKDYPDDIRTVIRQVAKELDISPDWINNDNVFDNDVETLEAMIEAVWIPLDLGFKNINISIADIETLTNSKIFAADVYKDSGRTQDIPDLLDLLDKQNITNIDRFNYIYGDKKRLCPDAYEIINKYLKGQQLML